MSQDGSRIVSGSYDRTIRIWDMASGHCLQTLEGHSDWVRAVAISHDGSRIVSGSDDGTIRIWDMASGHCLQTLEGHSDWVRAVAISHNGSRIVSGSLDGTVRIWDMASGHCLQRLEIGIVDSLSFDKDGDRIFSDLGVINVLQRARESCSFQNSQATPETQRFGYGISSDRCWITLRDNNLIWLPANYRPVTSAVASSIISIGCVSGRVIAIRFSGNIEV